MEEVDYSIRRFRGDTYPIVFSLVDKGIIVDLQGAVVKMTIAFRDPEPLTIVGTIMDDVGGKVRFDFTSEMVDQIGKFFYDIQVVDGGHVTTYVKDIIDFVRDVTPE